MHHNITTRQKAYMPQHKMHSIHVITSQQNALNICQNITRCTAHIP